MVRPLPSLPDKIDAADGVGTRLIRLLRRTRRNLATQDYVILAFHFLLLARAALAPPGPLVGRAWHWAVGMMTLSVSMVILCRGEILPAGRLRAIVYRTMAICCIMLSYFEMGWLLPAMQPVLRDSWLLALDEKLFGVTPAVWLEAYLNPATAQWFSFFYYSYVWLMLINLGGSAAFDRQRSRMHEVLTGGALIGAIGHSVYTVMPGVGPIRAIKFAREIPQVFWWRQVEVLVGNAGALLDIFPSLHTAFPTLFALHAIRHRRTRPFSFLWPVSAFFAVNIIIATLFLRWHYAVDVIAGLGLAVLAQRLAMRDVRAEPARQEAGRQPTYEGVRASEL